MSLFACLLLGFLIICAVSVSVTFEITNAAVMPCTESSVSATCDIRERVVVRPCTHETTTPWPSFSLWEIISLLTEISSKVSFR